MFQRSNIKSIQKGVFKEFLVVYSFYPDFMRDVKEITNEKEFKELGILKNLDQ